MLGPSSPRISLSRCAPSSRSRGVNSRSRNSRSRWINSRSLSRCRSRSRSTKPEGRWIRAPPGPITGVLVVPPGPITTLAPPPPEPIGYPVGPAPIEGGPWNMPIAGCENNGPSVFAMPGPGTDDMFCNGPDDGADGAAEPSPGPEPPSANGGPPI